MPVVQADALKKGDTVRDPISGKTSEILSIRVHRWRALVKTTERWTDTGRVFEFEYGTHDYIHKL